METMGDVSVLNKKDYVGKKLQEREEERTEKMNKRKEESEKVTSKTENIMAFMETLTAGVAAIKEGLAKAPAQNKANLPSHFDSLSQKLAEVQKFVTDSALFLSSYDLAQKQQQLNELQLEISSSRSKLLPKAKFAFKNRKKQTASPDASAQGQSMSEKTTSDKPTSKSLNPTDYSADEYRITDLSEKDTTVPAKDVFNKDVIVSSVARSSLNIFGAPSAMHLNNLSDCTVLAGPCGRSIFIESCSNCVFVLACQQLRIHNAVNCTFFIHVTSKAIIEDSKGLKFAPYKLSYDDIGEHYVQAGLNKSINNWYDVDDFNWLVADKQSPNWSILPESERIGHKM